MSVVVVGFFLIRCLAYFIIICLQLLTCIRFVTDWLTTEIYRVDKSHRRLRVTNIMSVLFSKRLSIKWDIFFSHKKLWSSKILVKLALHLVQFNTIKVFKILVPSFQIVFAAPLFNCNVFFYIFDFERYFAILCRGLSKYRRCRLFYYAIDTTKWRRFRGQLLNLQNAVSV